jgi:hypothetical protein
MQKTINEYIGKPSIRNLRDYILDKPVSENDTILMNQIDFDEMALEYRETYNENVPIPYYLLSVLIKEDENRLTPVGRIRVIKADSDRFFNDYCQPKMTGPSTDFQYDTIYRCGYCGNVVDYDGSEFDDSTRRFKISVLEKFKYTITEKDLEGACCRNRRSY